MPPLRWNWLLPPHPPLKVAGGGLPLPADDILRFRANYSEKAMSLLFFQKKFFLRNPWINTITDKSLTHNGFDADELEGRAGGSGDPWSNKTTDKSLTHNGFDAEKLEGRAVGSGDPWSNKITDKNLLTHNGFDTDKLEGRAGGSGDPWSNKTTDKKSLTHNGFNNNKLEGRAGYLGILEVIKLRTKSHLPTMVSTPTNWRAGPGIQGSLK
jgi:hypothetical protein